MQIKKGELNFYIQFLDELKLPNKASLGRTKLKNNLVDQLKEFTDDQSTVIDEYKAWKDKDKGTFRNDVPELNEAMNTLLNDNVEIKFNSPFKKDFVKALENYDEELSGASAEVYANLYENLIEENE